MALKTWNRNEIKELYALSFPALMLKAMQTHAENFPSDEIELCKILSIKTGACPEDCSWCSQSGHYKTGVMKEKLMPLDDVLAHAKEAKANGATRFCMGAAWRNPPQKDFPKVIDMIKAVKEMGLEACVTLGTLSDSQVHELKAAGLDFYNHNLETSAKHFEKVTSTRTYQDRLDTLAKVGEAGLRVCCGGILGMGETQEDRIDLLLSLASLPTIPESVPINHLIPMLGTPLANVDPIDPFEFVRTIAVARIILPTTVIRLSAGRTHMSEEMQTLCFLAGANSMWIGGKLLTAKNPEKDLDYAMLSKLGMRPKQENSSVN